MKSTLQKLSDLFQRKHGVKQKKEWQCQVFFSPSTLYWQLTEAHRDNVITRLLKHNFKVTKLESFWLSISLSLHF